MAKLINLNTISDKRGSLTVMEDEIPFEVKRMFYIYDVDNSIRGKHRHKNTRQAAVCVKGSCKIYSTDGTEEMIFLLDKPDVCLLIEPIDWHYMFEFSKDAVLLVVASTRFDKEDYIFEEYGSSKCKYDY